MHVQVETAQIKVANRPLWAPGAGDVIKRFLRARGRGVRVLEFGSGGSTIFLLRNGAQVTAVEHMDEWATAISVKAARLRLSDALTILRRDRPYHDVPAELGADASFDLLLVDGRDRVECLAKALPLVKPDGLVLLDDAQRSRYWPGIALLAHAPCTTFQSRARDTTIWALGEVDANAAFVTKTFVRDKPAVAPSLERKLIPADYLDGPPLHPGYRKKTEISGLKPVEDALQRLGLIERWATYLSPGVYALQNASVRNDGDRKLLCLRGATYRARSGDFVRYEEAAAFEGAVRLAGTTFDLTAPGAGLYSFFLFDSLPKLQLLAAAGRTLDDFDHILVNTNAGWSRDILTRLLGEHAAKVVAYEPERPSFSMEQSLHIEGLRYHRFTPRWTLDFLQETFGATETAEGGGFGRFVYISRQRSHGRRIANHDAFLDLIVPLGFVEIFAEDHAPADLARKLGQAEVLISPHGAGLANMIFCPATTRVIELFASHFTPQYFHLARDRGQPYEALACIDATGQNVFTRYTPETPNKSAFNREDIVVPLAELRELLTETHPPDLLTPARAPWWRRALGRRR